MVEGLSVGDYAYRAMAISLARPGKFTEFQKFKVLPLLPDKNEHTMVILLLPATVVIGAAILIYYYRRKFTWPKRGDDEEGLMQAMELQDFTAPQNVEPENEEPEELLPENSGPDNFELQDLVEAADE